MRALSCPRLSARFFCAFLTTTPLNISRSFRHAPISPLLTVQRHVLRTRPFATITAVSPHPQASPSDPTSYTSASLLTHLKEKISNKAVRKVVTLIEETESGKNPWGVAGIRPDASIFRTAIRALISAARPDLATHLYTIRIAARASRPADLYADIPLASAVLRSVHRNSKKRNERRASSDVIFADIIKELDMLVHAEEAELQKLAQYLPRNSQALMSTCASFLAGGNKSAPASTIDVPRAREALACLTRFSKLGQSVAAPVEEYNNLIRVLGKARQLYAVFDVIDAMDACQVEKNNETFEFLANATLKQVKFITGAVSMDTLPDPDKFEVAFIGRSNVGKSSLVNMICNRRALAYVSGRPGKTQQFNYFLVNELDNENQFYIVDLPGVGYAKVPLPVKEKWLQFMRQYFRYRENLQVVFHLVDGRHGPLADDEELMAEMASVIGVFKYVVVLTKMDKLDRQRVSNPIRNKTRDALRRNGCGEDVPIVPTSSLSKLGRDEMWRQLLFALKPKILSNAPSK